MKIFNRDRDHETERKNPNPAESRATRGPRGALRDKYHDFEEERARERLAYDGREAPDYESGRNPGDLTEPFSGPPAWPRGPSFTSQFYGPFADNETEREGQSPTAPPGHRTSNGNRWGGDRETTQAQTPPWRRRNRADYSQPVKSLNEHALHSGSYGYDQHAYQYDQLDEDLSGPDVNTTYSRQFLGPFGGVGPRGYKRTDDRVREEVCEILMRDSHINASNVEVNVKDGDVTLTGTVPDRRMKFRSEDLIQNCFGVREIHNQLRVVKDGATTEQ